MGPWVGFRVGNSVRLGSSVQGIGDMSLLNVTGTLTVQGDLHVGAFSAILVTSSISFGQRLELEAYAAVVSYTGAISVIDDLSAKYAAYVGGTQVVVSGTA
eukprot:109469-Prymnesium_polylepis.3